VFRSTFKRLRKVEPRILYPSLSTAIFDQPGQQPHSLPSLSPSSTLFLSINRYERKKNLALAIRSFARLPEADLIGCHLILAGGYDPRVQENLDYFTELEDLARSLNLGPDRVTLLRSPSDAEKVWLLHRADCLLYTPAGEHFGIVPLEAMYCSTPVLAVDSGGPRETVVDGVTGWLREPTSEAFGTALSDVLRHKDQLGLVGAAGRQRVQEHFSFGAFAENLDAALLEALRKKQEAQGRGFSWLTGLAVAFHFTLAMCVLFYMTFGTPLA
jgi:alpha-1,3/alpha-1,6-mannosyltransferase